MAERNSLYNLPTGWSSVSNKYLIEKNPLTGKKVKQRDYQTSGSLPIIDQGRDYIGGYSNLQDIAVPVSYTHLRAHETRHDLVCRLLLEKKKITRPDNNKKYQTNNTKKTISYN